MQWSALLFVLRGDPQAFLLEVCQTVSLITLCRDVQHINPLTGLYLIISLIAHQKFDQLNVTVETSEV